ncbi:MAG: hypothetical protein L0Z53_19760, partial [Acidobacteriales bacterium]|nr:hypothetical protein [Terriglobales bacterium]
MTLVRSIRARQHRAHTQRPAGPSTRPEISGKCLLRDGKKLALRGVTYGPFAPNRHGQPFPARDIVRCDFARIREAGFNSVRTYHVPPQWIFDLAVQHDLMLFVDVPWPKHVCFLDSRQAQQQAREAVRSAARQGRDHPALLAYSIGNEIPTEIVRWHGPRRIERFLAELHDEVKQVDPAALVTYASYPPTEYLDLSFLDFVTFNVYLHHLETFRRYMFRLQNTVGDKPLVLGELGMDTVRHGENAQ